MKERTDLQERNEVKKIRKYIHKSGVKQCHIAKEIGRSESEISLMLNGKMRMTVEDLVDISNALKSTPNELLGITG